MIDKYFSHSNLLNYFTPINIKIILYTNYTASNATTIKYGRFFKQYYRLLCQSIEFIAALTAVIVYKNHKNNEIKYFLWIWLKFSSKLKLNFHIYIGFDYTVSMRLN